MADAQIIDGKAIAGALRAQVAAAVNDRTSSHGDQPGLAVILVGNNPASQVYVRNKGRQTRDCGMQSFEHKLPTETTQDSLLALIAELNDDDAVDGILVQLPLPAHIDPDPVLDAIDPSKDVDGFHVINAGGLVTGRPVLVPCTPLGCLMMLKDRLGDMSGLNAVVVGRSNIVGKPMAALLLREHCTVTIAHSRTRDLPAVCRTADILIAAVGRPEMIRGGWVRPGATVIDVGINRIPAPGPGKTRLVGDVAFAEAVEVAGVITPVPGGVGPMTIACLLNNTLLAACRRRNWPAPSF